MQDDWSFRLGKGRFRLVCEGYDMCESTTVQWDVRQHNRVHNLSNVMTLVAVKANGHHLLSVLNHEATELLLLTLML